METTEKEWCGEDYILNEKGLKWLPDWEKEPPGIKDTHFFQTRAKTLVTALQISIKDFKTHIPRDFILALYRLTV